MHAKKQEETGWKRQKNACAHAKGSSSIPDSE